MLKHLMKLAWGGVTQVRIIAFWTICVIVLATTQAWVQTRLNRNQLPLSLVVVNGIAVLGTSAISSGTCATVVTVSAPGVLTTDNILADFNADPTGVTGYAPTASGILTIIKYPTANNVNFKVCNSTNGSITPGAVITLNWRVLR